MRAHDFLVEKISNNFADGKLRLTHHLWARSNQRDIDMDQIMRALDRLEKARGDDLRRLPPTGFVVKTPYDFELAMVKSQDLETKQITYTVTTVRRRLKIGAGQRVIYLEDETEKPKIRMAKIEKTGQIVRILGSQENVKFSDEKNWLYVDTEPGRRQGNPKWIPASTRFAWVKDFDSLKERKTQNYQGIDISISIDKDDEYVDDDDLENQTMYVQATSGGKELGHVLFTMEYDSQGLVLNPQDLEVDERYRGQGIAAIMYDYVKSQGYRIRRSGQQTDAGQAFWQKHRPSQNVWESQRRLPAAIEEFLDSLNPDDCGVEDIGAYRIHFEGFTSDCKSSADYRRDPEAVYQQVYRDFIQREGGQQPLVQDMVGDEDFPILYSIFRRQKAIKEDQQAYLYHATYGPLLKSIQAKGLGNTTQSQWTDSQPGVVYLARNPEVARSYAEAAESVPEEWLDQIVVLQIPISDLDPKLLKIDSNVRDNRGDTMEYHAIIPAKLLSVNKLNEVNYPDELRVGQQIQDHFFRRGYQLAGEGRDQMAFFSPRNTVVKVLGIGENEREDIVKRYVSFFVRNQQNPYYPRIYNTGDFEVDGETYFVYEQEYLNYVANEEATLDYLEKLMSAVDRGYAQEFMEKNPLPAELNEDELYGLLETTEDLIEALGGHAPLDLSNIENLRRREDGHLVIMDPFSL